MNTRERYLEAMNFNTSVPTMKWEFAYWSETLELWYQQGLPENNYPYLPTEMVTPTKNLYTFAWNSVGRKRHPKGAAATGGSIPHPSQGWSLDTDVRDALNMDKSEICIDVNLLFYPMFEPKVVREDDQYLDYLDLNGVTNRFQKGPETYPSAMAYPITDWASWNKLKEERLNLDNIKDRFAPNWKELVADYKDRDYPLAIGGYPHGFFGTLAVLMGYEGLFLNYVDAPDLIHDINSTFCDLWIAIYSEVFQEVKPDSAHIWEDISYGSGSMVNPDYIREFMLPYYKKLTGFLKSEGVEIIFLDTDGDCMDILPIFIEGGVNGFYPFEWHCGMEVLKVRKAFPEMRMRGGFPKSEIQHGPKRIDELLEPIGEVIKTGGYIPHGDHFVPPTATWELFSYYRTRLNEMIEAVGRQGQ